MNEAPAPEAPPQAPVFQPIKQQIECANCHEQMIVILPLPIIQNHIMLSSISFVHVRPDSCPKCRAMYMPQVGGFDETGGIMFQWVRVKGEHSPIITNTGGDAIKKAIEAASAASQLRTTRG